MQGGVEEACAGGGSTLVYMLRTKDKVMAGDGRGREARCRALRAIQEPIMQIATNARPRARSSSSTSRTRSSALAERGEWRVREPAEPGVIDPAAVRSRRSRSASIAASIVTTSALITVPRRIRRWRAAWEVPAATACEVAARPGRGGASQKGRTSREARSTSTLPSSPFWSSCARCGEAKPRGARLLDCIRWWGERCVTAQDDLCAVRRECGPVDESRGVSRASAVVVVMEGGARAREIGRAT